MRLWVQKEMKIDGITENQPANQQDNNIQRKKRGREGRVRERERERERERGRREGGREGGREGRGGRGRGI